MTTGEDGEEEMNTTYSDVEDKEYEILSVQPGNNFPYVFATISKRLKMGQSMSYDIDYV